MPDLVAYQFKKNTKEVVRATLKEWDGKDLVDIRVHFQDTAGEWRPGPKGLCLQASMLPELKIAVEKLGAAIAEKAWK